MRMVRHSAIGATVMVNYGNIHLVSWQGFQVDRLRGELDGRVYTNDIRHIHTPLDMHSNWNMDIYHIGWRLAVQGFVL